MFLGNIQLRKGNRSTAIQREPTSVMWFRECEGPNALVLRGAP